MSDTEQIRRAALTMIERFGEDALRQVDLRIAELREHGDEAAVRLWIEIRPMVEAMSRKPTTGRRH